MIKNLGTNIEKRVFWYQLWATVSNKVRYKKSPVPPVMLVALHIRRVWRNQGPVGKRYCVVLTPKWIENVSPRGRFVSHGMKVSQIVQKMRHL